MRAGRHPLRALSVGIALVLLGSATASALPDEPPRAYLRYRGERIQKAHLAASCWPGENGGMLCGEASPMTWPKVDRVKAGAALRLRIRWKRKPNRVFVETFRSVNRKGRPRDRGHRVPARKRPVRREHRLVAWDVVFRLKSVREHYVRVLVRYPETAVWNVHVRTRR